MKIGCVREIKNMESRVGLTPEGAGQLFKAGHSVMVESHAGQASGFLDSDYIQAGAKMVVDATEVWKTTDLVVKVKEPQPSEYPHIRPGQMVFTYFHFASNESLLNTMLASQAVSIAYETVGNGIHHPLLAPMSEIAGRMSVLEGANLLSKSRGGKGLLLSGVSGVAPGHCVILGSGNVGRNAAQMAQGLQARLTFLVHPSSNKVELQKLFPLAGILDSTVANLEKILPSADLVIGAVYVSGEKAPKLVSRKMIASMKPGSVVVDVSIDQGGCLETSRPTTHENPTFVVDGVVHYCVANMPGAYPKTSTLALTNATRPYLQEIADGGLNAFQGNADLRNGLSTLKGKLVQPMVAKTFNRPVEDPLPLLG
jgi:alanine dehydrogenase